MTIVKWQMVEGAQGAPFNQMGGSRAKRHRLWSLVHWSLVIAAAALAAAACGRKGPIVLPRVAASEPVANLTAVPQANTVLLTWTRPARDEEGGPLVWTPDYLLFRRSFPVPPAGAPEGNGARSLEGFVPLATVRGAAPDNARLEGTFYAFRDDEGGAGLAYGQRYEYRLVARDNRGYRSRPSNLARVDLVIAASPPADLQATAGEARVDLAWSAPTARVDGTPLGPLRGYNVYRSEQAGTFPEAAVNPQPVRETRYADGGLPNDRTYFYVVRAVEGDAPAWRESGNSNMVAATPRDTTPPAPPRGLQGAASRSGVSLIWDRSQESDLRGYYVYRSEVPGTAYQRLTPEPIRATTFADRAVARDATYYYVVTAVDTAPRPNESTFSDEVAIRIP
jgi:fibronectin type 3 domain-containing protein/predicted small lipoprotein YifL